NLDVAPVWQSYANLSTQLSSISFILTRTLNSLCDRAYWFLVTAIALGSSLRENTIGNNT
ncbi:hypothetical protein, partial [Geitlerinema sp. P-1104]|uniref:hypothetical protein n=1 Tax=Geitlerinema sp. P-1104 TaxID=2546230 RepID=UPI001980DA9A